MLVTCIYSITDITRCQKFPKRQLNEIILVLVTKTKMIVPNRFAENLGWGGMLAWNDIELKTNHDQRYFLFSTFNGWILIFNTSLKSKEMLNVLIFTSLQIWALDASLIRPTPQLSVLYIWAKFDTDICICISHIYNFCTNKSYLWQEQFQDFQTVFKSFLFWTLCHLGIGILSWGNVSVSPALLSHSVFRILSTVESI